MPLLLLFLLVPFSAEASGWREAWRSDLAGAPRAAYFLVATGEVLVSVEEAKEARLLRLSPEGKVLGTFARAAGPAGPIRSYGERVYWATGKQVLSFDLQGEDKRVEGEGDARDLALDRKGKLYVAGEAVKTGGVVVQAQASAGLFYLNDQLFSLSEGKVLTDVLGKERVKLCDELCHGLERASDGTWLVVEGNKVVKMKRTPKGSLKSELLAQEQTPPGRIGYVYRKESREDLVVVPLPAEKRVKAYTLP